MNRPIRGDATPGWAVGPGAQGGGYYKPIHPTVAAHIGALTMGLLVRTLRAAAELAVAMDARGFATAQSRSWWLPAPWRVRDTLLVALATMPLVVAVTAR